MGTSRLTYEGYSHTTHYKEKDGRRRNRVFNFYRCQCGRRKVIREHYVNTGHTRSCGCLRADAGRRTWKKNLGYHKGRGGWDEKFRHMPSPNKGKIRIKENGRIRFVSEEELAGMFWGVPGGVCEL